MPRAGVRPHVWKIGTDPVDHKLYVDAQRAKAQAKYRGELWEITEQEYIDIWRKDDAYLKKGRGLECLCLTRIDFDLDWTVDNVELISRHEHYKKCSSYGRGLIINFVGKP